VYANVSVSRLSIPDCPISNVFFLCNRTIRNGQSKDTDIDIHNKKMLEMWQSGMNNLEILTLTYTRKKTLVIWQSGMENLETRHWHTQEKDVRDMTIRNGQSRDIDIFSIPHCPISSVFFLCISMSISLDCPFLIVTSLNLLLVYVNISVSRLSRN
jgi:hypothetical protein